MDDAAMTSTPAFYPSSHDVALERVMRLVDLVAARPDSDDKDLVIALLQSGVGEVDAALLVRFVPCAFSFAMLKLMGLSRFPSTFQVKDEAGRWVEMPLAAEHYFVAALGVGHEMTTRGYTKRISKETFRALVCRSAELDSVNRFLEAGNTAEELAGRRSKGSGAKNKGS